MKHFKNARSCFALLMIAALAGSLTGCKQSNENQNSASSAPVSTVSWEVKKEESAQTT